MAKKIIGFALLLTIIIGFYSVGCDLQGERPIDVADDEYSSEEMEKIDHDIEGDIMSYYDSIIKGDNEPYILIRFIDKNIKTATGDETAEMLLKLEAVQEKYIDRYVDQLFTEGYQMELLSLSEIPRGENDTKGIKILDELFFDESKVDEIKNGDLKDLIQKLIEGKYRLINLEGAFYPIIDYEELAAYEEYVTEEIGEYIRIRALESKEPIALDAELIVTFDQLSQRLIDMENYMIKYPKSKKYDKILELYEEYLDGYLAGLPNSPIYDYETKIIREDVRGSYERLMLDENVNISQVVAKYMDIIEENGNKIDNSVLSKVSKLKKEAIDKLRK
ncbi:MAG TPA: hypothetical protein GXX70_08580 [Tepidimicrobium sp.]|nr:hypothetical protein [Tepidimicrobium sp.]